jgi:hypothetical protein
MRLQPLMPGGLIAANRTLTEVTPAGRWFLRNIAMALSAFLPQQLAEARPVLSRTV